MKQAAKYLALFLAAFVIAGGTAYLGVRAFTRSAPEVVVPDLVGQNIIKVLETLTRMGLNPKLHRTQFHDSIPKYGVSFQDPEPGATIKKGRDVILYISKGIKQIQMPDIRQIPLKEGLIKLEELEIQPGTIVHVYSAGTAKGAVMAQYPLPRARISAGSSCSLLISRGAQPVDRVMPDLVGLGMDDAIERLTSQGLSIGSIGSGTNSLLAQGEVLEQIPASGSRIAQTRPVQLVINRSEAGLAMDTDALNRTVLVSQWIPDGFSNRHVRMVCDLAEAEVSLYNGYMKPGKMINLLIPGGIKTKIRIFIDHELVQIKRIDPWRRQLEPVLNSWHWHLNTGDFKWES